MTEEELAIQLALNDARIRVSNGQYVTPEEYRGIVAGIRAGHEAKLAAQQADSKQRTKARKEVASTAKAEQLLEMLKQSLALPGGDS